MNETISPLPFPDTLRTTTPAQGHALASRLTSAVFNQPTTPISSIAESLRRQSDIPSPELISATYFHAISIANAGWRS